MKRHGSFSGRFAILYQNASFYFLLLLLLFLHLSMPTRVFKPIGWTNWGAFCLKLLKLNVFMIIFYMIKSLYFLTNPNIIAQSSQWWLFFYFFFKVILTFAHVHIYLQSKNSSSNPYCSTYICWNYHSFVLQLWLFQGKICLVFDICCWYLLSWFWSYNCSWLSKLVDFTGTCPSESLFWNFSV